MQATGIFAVLMIVGGTLDVPPGVDGHALEADTADFTLVKSAGDIAVYERWYTATAGQSAREVKATFTVRAEPGAAAALIKDEGRSKKWNKNVEAYKVLTPSENSWICYIQYDLPWPVSNQDCVLEYNEQQAGNWLEVTFKGIEHPSFPVRRRVQRIPEISGKWIFTRIDGGISVEYYITTLPSNSLPTWLTDPIIRNNLVETMSSFRKILEGKPS